MPSAPGARSAALLGGAGMLNCMLNRPQQILRIGEPLYTLHTGLCLQPWCAESVRDDVTWVAKPVSEGGGETGERGGVGESSMRGMHQKEQQQQQHTSACGGEAEGGAGTGRQRPRSSRAAACAQQPVPAKQALPAAGSRG